MRLCQILNIATVEQAKRQMSNRQFCRWLAYFERNGWPDDREDSRAAAIVLAVASSKGAKMSMETAQNLVNPWGAMHRTVTASKIPMVDKLRAMGGG